MIVEMLLGCDDKVSKKIAEPDMSVRDNPLMTQTREELAESRRQSRNMERLRIDKSRRTGIHGSVYSGIMSVSFGKEKE